MVSTAPATGACVCDQEADGKLGATLGVMNAPALSDLDKTYVALRNTVTLTGQAFSSDLMAGTVTASVEQSILGCHRAAGDCTMADLNIVQGVAPIITQSDASKDSCLASTFIAKRVDPSVDCMALKSMKAMLFEQ
jgi:hypothetical protein